MFKEIIIWLYESFGDLKIKQKELAKIQYHGTPGITKCCIEAIARILQYGDRISKVRLLTNPGSHSNGHCFLLQINEIDSIAIKSGFSSGYGGEGPKGLSTVLQLFLRHGYDIEEYIVDAALMERLDDSCLLQKDIDYIDSLNYVRPIRYYDYICRHDVDESYDHDQLNHAFSYAIPYRIIDKRIIDLAIKLPTEPDSVLLTGYRRLEDIVRKRIDNSELHGAKLFSKAFQVDDSLLFWDGLDPAEAKGRGALFTAVFMSYRNPRAHIETEVCDESALREFLLLNELYILESSAKLREHVD